MSARTGLLLLGLLSATVSHAFMVSTPALVVPHAASFVSQTTPLLRKAVSRVEGPCSRMTMNVENGGQSVKENGISLAEQAAQALKDAQEAEERAETLRQAKMETPQPSTASPTTKTVKNEEPVVAEDPEKVAEEIASEIGKLQRSPGSRDPLAGTRWLLRLDFGREQGTWMDARWGASGSRLKAVVAVELLDEGKVGIVEGYNYGLLQQLPNVRGLKWNVEGNFPSERLKFQLEHDGLSTDNTRCDVDVPEGKLFFSVNTLGAGVSKQGGMSIEQYRFFVRRERRIVGVFRAERLE